MGEWRMGIQLLALSCRLLAGGSRPLCLFVSASLREFVSSSSGLFAHRSCLSPMPQASLLCPLGALRISVVSPAAVEVLVHDAEDELARVADRGF
jgi:hypothetical protein